MSSDEHTGAVGEIQKAPGIDPQEFRTLYARIKATANRERTWTEHDALCKRIYEEGTPGQRGAVSRLLGRLGEEADRRELESGCL